MTGAEPVETHPDFTEIFGKVPMGKKGTNEQGATFDEVGKFVGFAFADEDNPYYGEDPASNMAGVRSYLAPSVVYTETATYSADTRSQADLSLATVGKITDPPPSDLLPNTSEGQNWLQTGLSADQQGEGLQVRRSFRASGPLGWNPTLYGGEDE